jgi:hypothetical protein
MTRSILQPILAIAALAAVVPVASGQTSMHVTPVEIAQLPRFCWAQLEVPNAKGDDFRIISCGPAANHYCSGLIYMIRAKGHVTKQTRLDLLGHADSDVKYTEKAIADYPQCSIREHVAGTRVELNQLLTMFGYKRQRAQ